jgi:hypothetical protein
MTVGARTDLCMILITALVALRRRRVHSGGQSDAPVRLELDMVVLHLVFRD